MAQLFASLRVRLVLLVLLAILPGIALTIYSASEDRQREVVEAQSETLRLAQVISAQEDELIATTRQLLISLAHSSDVRVGDPAQCSALLASLLKDHFQRYANLGAIKLNGDIFCSATPLSSTVNVADRTYFQRAVQTVDFAMGDYQIGRVTGKPSINFGYPVTDSNGHVQGAVFAALDLAELGALEQQVESKLPADTALTKIDRNGLVLVRYPDPETWVGHPLPNASLVKTVLTQRQGMAEVLSPEGLPRVYAFAPIHTAVQGEGTYVILDFPQAAVFAEVSSLLSRNLIVLGISAALALAAAWAGGDALVLHRIRALVSAATRLAAGDLSTRAGLPHERGEMSQLAHAFDQMAESLQRREVERKQTGQALRQSEELYRTLAEAAHEMIFVISRENRVQYINSFAAKQFGRRPDEVIGRRREELFPVSVSDQQENNLQRVFDTGEPLYVENKTPLEAREVWLGTWLVPLKDEPGGVRAVLGISRDITVRKEAEQVLQKSKERLELLYRLSLGLAESLDTREVAQRALDTVCATIGSQRGTVLIYDLGRPHLRVVTKSGYDLDSAETLDWPRRLLPHDGLAGWVAAHRQPALLDDVRKDERWAVVPGVGDWVRSAMSVPLVSRNELVGVFVTTSDREAFFTTDHLQLAQSAAATLAAAMANARFYADARQHAVEMETLNNIGQKLAATLNLAEIIELIGNEAGNLLRPGNLSVCLYDEARDEVDERFYLDRGERKPGSRFPFGEGLVSYIIRQKESILASDYLSECAKRGIPPSGEPAKAWLGVPITTEEQALGALIVWDYEREGSLTERDLRVLSTLAAQAAIAIKNARLYDETRYRLAELEAVNRISTALRVAQTIDEMLPILLDEALGVLNANGGNIWLYDPAGGVLRQMVNRGLIETSLALKPGEGLAGQVFATGQPQISREFRSDPRGHPSMRLQVGAGIGGGVTPIRTADRIVGVLFVAVDAPRELTPDEVRLMSTLAEMAGNAIHRMQLHEQTVQHVQRLSALHAIDIAISSSLDLRVTLGVLLDQVTQQLRVEAADILLLNPHTQVLEYTAGRGFRSRVIQQTHLRLGEGHAGRAALERRVITVPDLRADQGSMARSQWLAGEAFITYHGVPLVVKGQVKGVLEAFHRLAYTPDADWLEFLRALAQQAAIALDNAELFEGLQHANSELILAYDTTLEGWSSALDLRDKETEGHTQRVTELTLRLAQAMGIGDAELVHIRRGALLHDIGKMGIPDGILLKPDKLTEEEWEIMRRHPVYARKWLSPIAYLRPALDIPCCHHEKWDGTGYPRGLKGEEIPLAARIFAIADVWDALCSDRPYRRAWPTEKVREHIHSLAGTHFDPKVIDAFLNLQWTG
ncbi:MAG: GAF domain-containing protein [Chloroflexi bacterium]|nr:GAF domain-containing protein [Chloroflexota bacterium]